MGIKLKGSKSNQIAINHADSIVDQGIAANRAAIVSMSKMTTKTIHMENVTAHCCSKLVLVYVWRYDLLANDAHHPDVGDIWQLGIDGEQRAVLHDQALDEDGIAL